MIIFYHKKTGKIYGCILGRVHSEHELKKKDLIQPQNVDQKDIERKIFDIKQTKYFEKRAEQGQIAILNKKVVFDKDGNYLRLIKKPIVEEERPNAVETIVVNIDRSHDEIKKDFKENTQRYIKQSENLTFRELDFEERDLFIKVIEEVEYEKDILISRLILRHRAPFRDGLFKMYIVEDNGVPLAGAIMHSRGFRTIYKIGGVNKKGRELHAGDALFWNLMKEAKELGYKEFDVGGIFADWATNTQKKVNIFKERWGGNREKFE